MVQLIATMPVITLTYGCTVKFEAIDPTTGLEVTGVVIDNPVMYGYNLTTTGPAAGVNIVPLLTPILVGEQPDTLGSGG